MSTKVSLSQESLFFPLPFTSATIENVIKVENKLPPVTGDKSQNNISFKILSVVRHRYSVKPAVGFIAPGKSITISFSLDPEAIKREKDPEARVLPTKDTKDAVYIDVVAVDHTVAANKRFLMKFESAGDDKMSSAIQQDASAFWKTVNAKPQQKPAGAPEAHASNNVPEGVDRLRLRCIFNSRDQVPDTLVMQMKHGGHAAEPAASAAPRPPATRAPPSVTNRDSTAPPEFPPRRASVGASLNNRNSANPRASTASPPGTATPPPAAAPSPAPAKAATPTPSSASVPAAPASGAAASALNSIRSKMQHTAATAKIGGGSNNSAANKISLKSVLSYKIPYKFCAALLLLTVLCGLLDRHNVVTWLLAGK